MKKIKLCAALFAALAIACAAGGAVTIGNGYIAPSAEESQTEPDSVHNATSSCNCMADETQAVSIPYSGEPTIRYGVQGYAGISGPAWIVGNEAVWTECGSGSHALGSNASDGRSALTLTFKTESEVTATAYLWLYMEGDDNSNGELSVNGGEAVAVNLKTSKQHQAWDAHDPAIIAVDLTKGTNTIVLTMGENYTGWFHGFCLSPCNDAIHAVAGTKMFYGTATFADSFGEMTANHETLGLNAFDNAADYGKAGGATYKIYAPTTGEYNLGFFVMAGNGLANRAKFTLNDGVLKFDGKEYYSFDTSAGWSGDSWNVFTVTLDRGVNTLKIENSLSYLNADKTQELDSSVSGGVYVSNWWMHQISVERVPQTYLELDTSAVVKAYNPYRKFTSEGLVVKYMVDGTATVLTSEQYTISAPDLESFGSKEVAVTMTSTGLTSSYYVNVGNEGQAFEGKEISFNGTESTGKLSYYHYAEIAGEGTGDCAGRIFWIMSDKRTEGGGWQIGSEGIGPSENRQITLTLNVNNTGDAGTYLVKSYANANNFDCDYATISVNGGEARSVNVCSPEQIGKAVVPYIFETELESGKNTITIKMQEQYSVWWHDFEICPIDGAFKDSYAAAEGARAGLDCFDTSEMMWLGNDQMRSLSYWLNVTEAGRYTFVFDTEAVEGKSFTFKDNGRDVTIPVDASGRTSKTLELSAGLHKLSVECSGAAGDFDFSGFTLEKFLAPDSISLDTSEMNTELDNGGTLNVAKLKVTAKYGEEEKELAYGEYELIYPDDYSNVVAGTYTVTVRVLETEVTATFDLVVKAVRAATGLEVNTENVKTTLDNGETLNTADIVVKVVYNDGTKSTLASKDYNIKMPDGYDATKEGTYTVTVELVSDTTINATFQVTIKAAVKAKGCNGGVGSGALFAALGLSIAVITRKKKESE